MPERLQLLSCRLTKAKIQSRFVRLEMSPRIVEINSGILQGVLIKASAPFCVERELDLFLSCL